MIIEKKMEATIQGLRLRDITRGMENQMENEMETFGVYRGIFVYPSATPRGSNDTIIRWGRMYFSTSFG